MNGGIAYLRCVFNLLFPITFAPPACRVIFKVCQDSTVRVMRFSLLL